MTSIEELEAAHRAAEDAMWDFAAMIQVKHEAAGRPDVGAWTTREFETLRSLTEVARQAWIALQRARGAPQPEVDVK